MEWVRAMLHTVVCHDESNDVIEIVRRIKCEMKVLLPGKTIEARSGEELVEKLIAFAEDNAILDENQN